MRFSSLQSVYTNVSSHIKRNTATGKLLLSFFVASLTVIVVFLLYLNAFFAPVERLQSDWLRTSFSGEAPASRVVHVNITEQCLEQMSQTQNLSWPWPREAYGIMLDFISRRKARAAVFDFIFSEFSPRGVADDARFIQAITNSGQTSVIFSTKFSRPDLDRSLVRRFEILRQYPALFARAPWLKRQFRNFASFLAEQRERSRKIRDYSLAAQGPYSQERIPEYMILDTLPYSDYLPAVDAIGNVAIISDPDGLIRRKHLLIRHQSKVFPNLSLAAVCSAMKIDTIRVTRKHYELIKEGKVRYTIPVNKQGGTLIKFYSSFEEAKQEGKITEIRAFDLIQAAMMPGDADSLIPKGSLKDKIVIFGSSAPGLLDLRQHPFAAQDPGSYLHATMINNILNQDFITRLDSPLIIIFMLLAVLFASAFGSARLTAVRNSLLHLGMLLFVILLGIAIYAGAGLLLELSAVLVSILFSFLLTTLINYIQESRQKKQIAGAFSQLLAPAVLDTLMSDSGQLTQSGDSRDLTIFFSDLAGFTTLSEKLGTPDKLVEILNTYLTAMADIIIYDYNGYVDKYEGDAIMAFWGAPLADPEQAWKACHAALDNQQKLGELQTDLRKMGLPGELAVRIGINSGRAVVGMIGSLRKLNYTIIGDSVNLAARLEAANKMYKTGIMISEATRKQAETHIISRPLDNIRVKGKNEPVTVHELLAKDSGATQEILRLRDSFAEALDYYGRQDFRKTLAILQQIHKDFPEDYPTMLYTERCQQFLESPPPPDWDGVFTMTSK